MDEDGCRLPTAELAGSVDCLGKVHDIRASDSSGMYLGWNLCACLTDGTVSSYLRREATATARQARRYPGNADTGDNISISSP